MGSEEERRADTVAVSRKAFNYFITVAAGGTLVGAAALLNLAIDNASLKVRVEALEQFGQKTGRRWTFEDAARENGRQDRELEALRTWKDSHTEWGRRLSGGWDQLHLKHAENINKLETRVHDLEVSRVPNFNGRDVWSGE